MLDKYIMKFVVKFSKVWEGGFHIGATFCIQETTHLFTNNEELKKKLLFKIAHSEIYLMIYLGKLDVCIGRISSYWDETFKKWM